MSIKMLSRDEWLVQVQRKGVRRTRRGTGGPAKAKAAEAELLAELTHDEALDKAAQLLGVDKPGKVAAPMPTLRGFFEDRWVEHSKIVQNASTRRKQQSAYQYVLYYLGDRRLSDLLQPREVNAFIEAVKTNGPLMFAIRNDGKPWQRRVEELTHSTINKLLQCLRALLNLAHTEGILPTAPKIDLLPQDDSTAVIPPTEVEFEALLVACNGYAQVAPLLRAFAEFAAETGLRRGELLNLTWGSVDRVRGAVRVETQARARVINGRPWKPKHNKFREVPLSVRARAVVDDLIKMEAHEPDDLVFPNRGGAPFERVDGAPKGSGHGWLPDAFEAAGLKGRASLHSLRHRFAVQLLTGGAPITVV